MFVPDKIHIDIETYSSVCLKTRGVYEYATSQDFEILLLTIGYYNAAGRRVFEQYSPVNGIPVPADRWSWIKNPSVLKYAFNAMFERVCLNCVSVSDSSQWRCVMVKCGFAGLPMSLNRVSELLMLDNVKLAGTHLINYFSKPCKPQKANGGRCRNLPCHNTEKWEEYKTYNLADVAAEWDIDEYLDKNGLWIPAAEWEYYALDQRINDRGIYVDTKMAENGVKIASEIKTGLNEEISRITGITNPRSVIQLRAWLALQGYETPDLTSGTLKDILKTMAESPARHVVTLREQTSRTTTDKYAAAVQCAGYDCRARGLFAFNGASRTGRYAARRVQVHNLARIHFAKGNKADAMLDIARSIVCKGDAELFNMLYSCPIEILSQLIRTVFTAAPGKMLVAADYSAIEARVLAWLAGEEWKLEIFRTHGKIYEAMAAHMFGVPLESVTKGSNLRQKGKVGELAFGYGGSVGAVDKMGFLNSGTLTIDEVHRMVKRWRQENPSIVRMWQNCEHAAMNAVKYKGKCFKAGKCGFYAGDEWLFIKLPSGRRLSYFRPVIKSGKHGGSALWYEAEDDRKQWTLVPTYGGKLTENITQAVARDILCDAQYRIDRAGYDIVLHIHDEVVIETEKNSAPEAFKHICDLMATTPCWAAGLPLRANGFVSKYYRK
jgi:DNA polymerase